MKTQKEYQVAAKAETIANGGRSVGVLAELAKQHLTMHDGTHLPRIARIFCTTIDQVAKCAERHHELLMFVKEQHREIQALKLEISGMKSAAAQGVKPNTDRQPWEMSTDEFKAHIRETWQDPFGDECVSFGWNRDDTPLCAPKF